MGWQNLYRSLCSQNGHQCHHRWYLQRHNSPQDTAAQRSHSTTTHGDKLDMQLAEETVLWDERDLQWCHQRDDGWRGCETSKARSPLRLAGWGTALTYDHSACVMHHDQSSAHTHDNLRSVRHNLVLLRSLQLDCTSYLHRHTVTNV